MVMSGSYNRRGLRQPEGSRWKTVLRWASLGVDKVVNIFLVRWATITISEIIPFTKLSKDITLRKN